jgi:hypothetical protein
MFEPYAKYNISVLVECDADMQEASAVCSILAAQAPMAIRISAVTDRRYNRKFRLATETDRLAACAPRKRSPNI